MQGGEEARSEAYSVVRCNDERRSQRRRWAFFISLLLFVLVGSVSALAPERLRVSWSGASPANAPVWVAVEKGLFKKHEVQVEMQIHRGEHDRGPGSPGW